MKKILSIITMLALVFGVTPSFVFASSAGKTTILYFSYDITIE